MEGLYIKQLRVSFSDFWPNFQPTNNFFYNTLSIKFNVGIEDHCPDLVFFSCFGNKHLSQRGKKIHFTGETRKSQNYDFCFSFDETFGNNYRLPLWVIYINWFNLSYPNSCNPSYLVDLTLLNNRTISSTAKFCSFIYNNNSVERINFLNLLNKYKPIDSAGSLANSIGYILGGDEKTKLDYMKEYKFSICFENIKHKGYVTEKLLHAFASHTVPIYWGDAGAIRDFNKKSFIFADDFTNLQELVDYIIYLDQNENKRQDILTQCVFNNNKISPDFLPETICNVLAAII